MSESEAKSNDATSIKSTTSELKSQRQLHQLKSSPKTRKKQVVFKRPKLLILPSKSGFGSDSRISDGSFHPSMVWDRKGSSAFVMQQFKSGVGRGEKCAYWVYNKLKSWSQKWFTHIFLSIVLVLYTIGGAVLFQFIEGHNETLIQLDLRSFRSNLIRTLRNLSITMPDETSTFEWEGEAARRLKQYEMKIIAWHDTNKLIVENTKNKKWTFWNALVFCATIYTTIGYGHIYPETRTGKALTIVYAIIGIPLFLLALTDFGKLFTRCIKFLWSFVRRLYYTGSCRRARKNAHVNEIFKGAQMMYEIATLRRPSAFQQSPINGDRQQSPVHSVRSQQLEDMDTPTTPALSHFEIDDEFNLPISLALFLLILYIFLGGLIYCLWEGWDFFDSFYFVFISMSTVGFGDMVPDDAACMIVSIVYLVFGLALMSMCINVVQVKISDTFRQASNKLGATIGIVEDEDVEVEGGHSMDRITYTEEKQGEDEETSRFSMEINAEMNRSSHQCGSKSTK